MTISGGPENSTNSSNPRRTRKSNKFKQFKVNTTNWNDRNEIREEEENTFPYFQCTNQVKQEAEIIALHRRCVTPSSRCVAFKLPAIKVAAIDLATEDAVRCDGKNDSRRLGFLSAPIRPEHSDCRKPGFGFGFFFCLRGLIKFRIH